jgi:hypothetical protein
MASGEEGVVLLQESGTYKQHCEVFILGFICFSLVVDCNVFRVRYIL